MNFFNPNPRMLRIHPLPLWGRGKKTKFFFFLHPFHPSSTSPSREGGKPKSRPLSLKEISKKENHLYHSFTPFLVGKGSTNKIRRGIGFSLSAQSGSSLLEVLVAIIIFSMVFLALNNVLLISVRASASHQTDIQMQDFTRNGLTAQFLKDSQAVRAIRQSGKDHFTETKIIPLSQLAKNPSCSQDLNILHYEKNLYKITIRTTWEEKGKKRTKELSTLMDVQ